LLEVHGNPSFLSHLQQTLGRAAERAGGPRVYPPLPAANRTQLTKLTIKNRLLKYMAGASFIDMDRRAATYVDKILKGAKPAGDVARHYENSVRAPLACGLECGVDILGTQYV
jgi:hypothetical protein